MTAKHYLDAVALYIHTDFDLVHEEEVLRAFVEKLEGAPGVETINMGRYHMDISFGFLFDTAVCAKTVLEMFHEYYKVDAGTALSVEDIVNKALQKAENEKNLNTFADIFKGSSLN